MQVGYNHKPLSGSTPPRETQWLVRLLTCANTQARTNRDLFAELGGVQDLQKQRFNVLNLFQVTKALGILVTYLLLRPSLFFFWGGETNRTTTDFGGPLNIIRTFYQNRSVFQDVLGYPRSSWG